MYFCLKVPTLSSAMWAFPVASRKCHITLSYKLKINENQAAGAVNWSLLSSEFFKVNNGAWKIESLGPNQCKVTYSLEVEFNFSVPGFILKGIVKGTLPSMMNSFYERAKGL
jgi:ribosome-associated toxin RatA of RatAB toxin-antitoxin module